MKEENIDGQTDKRRRKERKKSRKEGEEEEKLGGEFAFIQNTWDKHGVTIGTPCIISSICMMVSWDIQIFSSIRLDLEYLMASSVNDRADALRAFRMPTSLSLSHSPSQKYKQQRTRWHSERGWQLKSWTDFIRIRFLSFSFDDGGEETAVESPNYLTLQIVSFTFPSDCLEGDLHEGENRRKTS